MEQKKFLHLKDIEAYRIAFHLSNRVWKIVVKWDGFSKNTIGNQFVRAVDSVSANLAKALGDTTNVIKSSFSDTAKVL